MTLRNIGYKIEEFVTEFHVLDHNFIGQRKFYKRVVDLRFWGM